MKRSNISKKLSDVRKVLKTNDTAVIGLGEESKVHEVESSRIMSSESAHYILVRGMDMESQSSQDEDTCEEEGEGFGDGWRGEGRKEVIKHTVEDDVNSGDGVEISEFGSNMEHQDCSEDLNIIGIQRKIDSITENRAVLVPTSSVTSLDEEHFESRNEVKSKLITKDSSDKKECGSEALDIKQQQSHAVIQIESDDDFQPEKTIADKTVISLVDNDTNNDTKETFLPIIDNRPLPAVELPEPESQLGDIETTQQDTSIHSSKDDECVMVMKEDDTTIQVEEAISPQCASNKEASSISTLQVVPLEGQETPNTERTVMELVRQEQIVDFNMEERNHQGSVSPYEEEGAGGRGEEEEREEEEGDDVMGALLLMDPTEAQKHIGQEAMELERERTQQNRAAASVSTQMYKEVQVYTCM